MGIELLSSGGSKVVGLQVPFLGGSPLLLQLSCECASLNVA